jgi:hypothetical protein
MWEPRPLTPLWAFRACYWDSFTFTLYVCGDGGFSLSPHPECSYNHCPSSFRASPALSGGQVQMHCLYLRHESTSQRFEVGRVCFETKLEHISLCCCRVCPCRGLLMVAAGITALKAWRNSCNSSSCARRSLSEWLPESSTTSRWRHLLM